MCILNKNFIIKLSKITGVKSVLKIIDYKLFNFNK